MQQWNVVINLNERGARQAYRSREDLQRYPFIKLD